MMRQLTVLYLLIVLSVAGRAGAQDVPNLLINADFESTVTTVVALDPDTLGATFNAPAGWSAYIYPKGQFYWQNAFPTGDPYRGRFTHTGAVSFKMGRGGATFTAALIQRVENLPAGTTVVGGASVYMQRDDNGGMARVGIAPDGGADPTAPNVVWSEFAATRSQWHDLQVSAQAVDSAVTLFLYATQERPSYTNSTYWDTAWLGIPTRPVDAPVVEAGNLPSGLIDVVIPNTNVHVRVGPGTEFESFALAQAGTPHPLISQDGHWYRINYFGRLGYVSADFTHVEQQNYAPPAAVYAPSENLGPPPAPAPGGIAAPGSMPPTGVLLFAGLGEITLHSGPRRDFPDVTQIPFGMRGDVVARTEFGWVLVRYGEFTGWSNTDGGQIEGDLGIVPVIDCC